MSSVTERYTSALESQASHPGGLRVNRLRWLLHYPKWPFLWASGPIVCAALACSIHWAFWIPTAVLLLPNWLYWFLAGDHFRNGCANPGMVVSLDPMMIAVVGSLSKTVAAAEEYLVIKVVKKGLDRIAGQLPQVGTRL